MKPQLYTAEFKESSVNLAKQSKRPIAQTARELGVNTNPLYTWMGKISKASTLKLVKGKDEGLDEENKRLKKELSRVTQERDILKKATLSFAKESL
jgi:transposase